MNKITHRCELPDNAKSNKRDYEGIRCYGHAISYCVEKNGFLLVGNGEYENQVNFCPICGYKAQKQIK